MRQILKIAFLCSLVFPAQAFAIVNIESMRVQKNADGFSGELELDSDLLSGNTDSKHVSFGNRLQWDKGNKTNFIITNYSYGESGGVRDVNKGFIHLRHVVHMNERWAWEGFGQMEQNEFTRLAYRGLIGGGLRRTLRQIDDRSGIYLGMGGFYSTERLDDNTTENLVRANVYFVIKHAFSDSTRLMSTTYFQPAVENLDDFRALEQLTYAVSISKRLDLKLSLDITHDSQPPSGVQPTDTGFHTGIKFKF
jgi:putative salt-induced outer membrane protein YdiY